MFHGPEGPARKADVKLVRYADDFVAMAKQMGSETIEYMESRLEGKLKGGDQKYLNLFPSKKAVQREREKLHEMTDSGG